MPTLFPDRIQAAREAGLPPLKVLRLLITGIMQRNVERRLARTRESGDFEAFAALLDRRLQLSETAAALLGATVPDTVFKERDAVWVWIERDLNPLDWELRRLAWAEGCKARAERAGNERMAVTAHLLGQAACDRIAALSRGGVR